MQKGQQNQEKLDQKLIWYFGCLRDPQTHPGAKKTPQMACESQIWPRCTPRGITSLFRTKELIFETDRSKLSHFTRNYPVHGFKNFQMGGSNCMKLNGLWFLLFCRPKTPTLAHSTNSLGQRPDEEVKLSHQMLSNVIKCYPNLITPNVHCPLLSLSVQSVPHPSGGWINLGQIFPTPWQSCKKANLLHGPDIFVNWYV